MTEHPENPALRPMNLTLIMMATPLLGFVLLLSANTMMEGVNLGTSHLLLKAFIDWLIPVTLGLGLLLQLAAAVLGWRVMTTGLPLPFWQKALYLLLSSWTVMELLGVLRWWLQQS